MKKAVHFGAGNIGRGFIGEVLYENDFHVTFVDINDAVISALQERGEYEVELADENHERIQVKNVTGINNQTHAEDVINAVADTNIVTTAIGPNILPFIAELIAKGIQTRLANGNTQPVDVIACENMIGGSDFLKEKVFEYLTEADKEAIKEIVGFPNAAVDRIVPEQHHEDPLFVSVEPFSEWVIDKSGVKATDINIDGVLYVDDLEPYIERKLFSVNTGHATVAYTGDFYGYKTIDEAMKDEKVLDQITRVLNETGQLLENKWNFDHETHQAYINKIIGRFKNPYISDLISRVARTPIRKLGYDERFIRPIRESQERGLSNDALVEVVGMIFNYQDANDEQSVELQEKLAQNTLDNVIREVTGLKDESLIERIKESAEKAKA